MIQWFKDLLTLVKDYRALRVRYAKDLQGLHESFVPVEAQAQAAFAAAKNAEALIRDRTTIHADIGLHKDAANFVIVVGNYKGRAYIQCYGMAPSTFGDVVGQLRAMKQEGHLGIIDAPPPFKAVIDTLDL